MALWKILTRKLTQGRLTVSNAASVSFTGEALELQKDAMKLALMQRDDAAFFSSLDRNLTLFELDDLDVTAASSSMKGLLWRINALRYTAKLFLLARQRNCLEPLAVEGVIPGGKGTSGRILGCLEGLLRRAKASAGEGSRTDAAVWPVSPYEYWQLRNVAGEVIGCLLAAEQLPQGDAERAMQSRLVDVLLQEENADLLLAGYCADRQIGSGNEALLYPALRRVIEGARSILDGASPTIREMPQYYCMHASQISSFIACVEMAEAQLHQAEMTVQSS